MCPGVWWGRSGTPCAWHWKKCLEEQGTQFNWRGDGNSSCCCPGFCCIAPRGGLKSKLTERFDKFVRGEWVQLLHASVHCDEQAAVVRRRKGRRGDDLERRAIRALNFVQLGELSSASQALEGAEIAPGTEDILTALRKSGGGVRGIVAGDVVRRLVSRTIALWNQRLRSATLSPLPKNTDYFVLLCLPPGVVLDIREGQPRPPSD